MTKTIWCFGAAAMLGRLLSPGASEAHLSRQDRSSVDALGDVIAPGFLHTLTASNAQSPEIPERVQQVLSRLEGRWTFELSRQVTGGMIRGVRTFRTIEGRLGVLQWVEEFDGTLPVRVSGYFGYAANTERFFEMGQISGTWPELYLGTLHNVRLDITFTAGSDRDRSVLSFESADRFAYRREVASDSAWTEQWRADFTRFTTGGR